MLRLLSLLFLTCTLAIVFLMSLDPEVEEMFEVEKLSDVKWCKGKNGTNERKFKTHWVGYPGQETWEWESQLSQYAKDSVEEFLAANNTSNGYVYTYFYGFLCMTVKLIDSFKQIV